LLRLLQAKEAVITKVLARWLARVEHSEKGKG
jgi:hypothetical protein